MRIFEKPKKTNYIPEEAKVIYKSKDGKEGKIFDVLEWLAAMRCQLHHIEVRQSLSHPVVDEG